MNCKFCGAPFVARNSRTEFPFTTFECEAYIFDDPSIPPARTVECRDGELARIKSELTAWRDLATALHKFLPRECSHEPGEACDICAAEKTYNKLKNPKL